MRTAMGCRARATRCCKALLFVAAAARRMGLHYVATLEARVRDLVVARKIDREIARALNAADYCQLTVGRSAAVRSICYANATPSVLASPRPPKRGDGSRHYLPLSSEARADQGCRKRRNQVPDWSEITCRFPPKSPAAFNRNQVPVCSDFCRLALRGRLAR